METFKVEIITVINIKAHDAYEAAEIALEAVSFKIAPSDAERVVVKAHKFVKDVEPVT